MTPHLALYGRWLLAIVVVIGLWAALWWEEQTDQPHPQRGEWAVGLFFGSVVLVVAAYNALVLILKLYL